MKAKGSSRKPHSNRREELMKLTLITLCAWTLGATLFALPGRSAEAQQADLSAKITAAKTAADHQAIAAEFEQEAKDLDAKAALHAEMAGHYDMDQYGHSQKPSLKKHCEDLAKSLKASAELARELAQAHHKLAQEAGK